MGQTLDTVKDVSGAIPVVGGVVAAVAGIAGNLGLKGKTTHLTWTEADHLAEPFSQSMVSSLESACVATDDDRLKVWTAFRSRMVAFIQSDVQGSTWWDSNTRNLYLGFYTDDNGLIQSTQRETLRHCFWLQAHWIYENVDGTHIATEGADKMQYVGTKVLIPSLVDAGVISQTADVKLEKGTLASDPATNVTSGLKLNTAALGNSKTLLYIGGALLLAAIIYQSTKGG